MQVPDPYIGRNQEGTLLAFSVVAMVVAVGLFLAIAEDVTTSDRLVLLDVRIATWLHAHASPGLTKFFLLVTYIHSLTAICVFAMILASMLARQRDWNGVLRLGLVVPGGLILNALLKQVYHRTRPSFDEPLLTLTTFSFPSGHTAGAVLFYGMLATVIMPRLASRGGRAACVLLAALLVAVVSLSRMYLGVHYLSDVLAAACASVAWLIFCSVAVHALSRWRTAR